MPDPSIQTGGLLFEWVQTLRVWEDSKTFPDSRPLTWPDQIESEFQAFLEQYAAAHAGLPRGSLASPGAFLAAAPDEAARRELTASLKTWLLDKFEVQPHSMEAHIEAMWQILERRSDELPANSTLIALPNPYIVAGGRYLESYYWDSYFTSLGLAVTGREATLRGMVDNFASLIRGLGYIPNGTRTYYLGRSQPPFFCHFLELLELTQGEGSAQPYLGDLRSEHAFWMDQSALESPGLTQGRRCVQLGAARLNRYWDENCTPRPEGFWEDIQTAAAAHASKQGAPAVYRHLRAAAESGWDFSSRWIAPQPGEEGQAPRYPLSAIHTTDLLPVDLNAMLYKVESWLARQTSFYGETGAAGEYAAMAAARKAAVLRLCWNAEAGWFFDYDMTAQAQTQVWSLAGVYPLFCKLLDASDPAEAALARRVRDNLAERFLMPGGVTTSLVRSGQQWDMPNGWAPLQWVAAIGMLNYGFEEEARAIAARFVGLARKTYAETGKMMEKYDVCDLSRPGGGGEYPNQEGFGWTNGVVTAFSELLERGEPSLAARLAASH